MAEIELNLPDRIDGEIDRLVDQGEFLNREQAIEELLSLGMSSYDTSEEPTRELDEELFSQTVEEQQDPAMQDDQPGDDYSF